jgi:hypothetical protein
MSELFGSDACIPQQMAERVQAVGVRKAPLPLPTQVLGRSVLVARVYWVTYPRVGAARLPST